MVTYLFRVLALARRIQLNRHGEVWNRTCKLSTTLVDSGSVMISNTKVWVLGDGIIEEVIGDVEILCNTAFSLEKLFTICKQLLSL